jgi:mono/diheme cytochrome c family protein
VAKARWLPLLTLLSLGACTIDDLVHRVGWFSNMRRQRVVRPYADPIPPPEGAVPIGGTMLPVSMENADALANPRPRTSESIVRGQQLYQIYCQVCHGEEADGRGPLAMATGGPFPAIPPLTGEMQRARTDGYIYGVIVNAEAMGRGLMPPYGGTVRGTDRWDIVNYVRTIQARARAAEGQ